MYVYIRIVHTSSLGQLWTYHTTQIMLWVERSCDQLLSCEKTQHRGLSLPSINPKQSGWKSFSRCHMLTAAVLDTGHPPLNGAGDRDKL